MQAIVSLTQSDHTDDRVSNWHLANLVEKYSVRLFNVSLLSASPASLSRSLRPVVRLSPPIGRMHMPIEFIAADVVVVVAISSQINLFVFTMRLMERKRVRFFFVRHETRGGSFREARARAREMDDVMVGGRAALTVILGWLLGIGAGVGRPAMGFGGRRQLEHRRRHNSL